MNLMKKTFLTTMALAVLPLAVQADVSLPSFFSNDMGGSCKTLYNWNAAPADSWSAAVTLTRRLRSASCFTPPLKISITNCCRSCYNSIFSHISLR